MLTTRAADGWYAYGTSGKTGEWTGEAWSGQTRDDASVTDPPTWHRDAVAFLKHRWFLLLVGFSLVTFLIALATNNVDHDNRVWWAIFSVTSFAAVAGFTLIFWPLMRFQELPELRKVLVWGFISGVVAISVAISIEGYLEPALKVPFGADLWLAGFIEETSKLLVPVLLWIFGKGVFRDPRAGFLMVLISGSVFGGVEAGQYITAAGENAVPGMAMVRPISETTHPVWAAIAATMIWFAAARLGRLVTWVGFVGWLLAAGLHSLHDGIASFSQGSGTKNEVAAQLKYASVMDGIVGLLPLVVFSAFWLWVSFLVLRKYAARELVPPTAIDSNAPHWRPRMVQWARDGEHSSV